MLSRCIPVIINKMPDIIIHKIFTHSLSDFANYVKQKKIDKDCIQCTLPHRYDCLHRL